MKKLINILTVIAVSLTVCVAQAADMTLLEFRNKIFIESKVIKLSLPKAKDMVFLNSMWDSCIITMSQLDAYFVMLGIFDTIRKEDVTEGAVNYLSDWLNSIKTTNELNVRNLSAISMQPVEAKTKEFIKKLIDYYTGLNVRINAEIEKVAALKAASRKERTEGKAARRK